MCWHFLGGTDFRPARYPPMVSLVCAGTTAPLRAPAVPLLYPANPIVLSLRMRVVICQPSPPGQANWASAVDKVHAGMAEDTAFTSIYNLERDLDFQFERKVVMVASNSDNHINHDVDAVGSGRRDNTRTGGGCILIG